MIAPDPEWDNILRGLNELREWFPDLVLIGGVAVWLQGKRLEDQSFLEVSHDADFLLSLEDYADLRDLEEVTPNRRLGKHQVIKNDVDFDIYVEHQNDLAVPYADALKDSELIDGYRVLSLHHLLALKLDAGIDRAGAKAEKDLRDVQRILILADRASDFGDRFAPYLTEKRKAYLSKAVARTDSFRKICHGNHADAAKYADVAARTFDRALRAREQLLNMPESDEQSCNSGSSQEP